MIHTSEARWRLFKVLAVFAVLLMSGCAKLTSIYRSQSLPENKPHLVSIDAKQRVVLSNPGKEAQQNLNIVRICAEPPPDVFTAMAASLSAEAALTESATPQAALKLATTLSENAATIERTQTINILREAMYRNCERYMSGAITEEEFIVQAARDQQLIVQVLAVEQITGVARAQSTALTTVAKAAAGGVSDAGLQILSEAKKDLEAKRAASAKAAAEAAALPPPGPCSANPVDETNLPSGVTVDQAKAKTASCAEEMTAAKLAKEAEDYFVLVQHTVAKQGAANSETQGKLASAAQNASEASTEIAEKVVEIVRQYQSFDEIGMTCVVKLRNNQELPEYCKKLIEQIATTREAELALKMQRIKLREAQLGLEEDRLNAARVKLFLTEMEAESLSGAESVWKKLGQGVTAENLKELTDKAGIELAEPHRKRLEEAESDFSAFAKAFKKLAQNIQDALKEAAESP